MRDIILMALICFSIPLVVYFVCDKIIKKILLNIPINLLLLIMSMIDRIFGYSIKNGQQIDLVDTVVCFFRDESRLILWVMWVPMLLGFVIVNSMYLLRKKY